MRYHIAAFAIAALLMGSVLAACGQDVAQGEKVATGPCVQCHSNLVTCSNLDKNLSYWENTVNRMVKKGMDISDQEQEAVVEYLSGLEPGSSPICD
jgi:cytochrome c5